MMFRFKQTQKVFNLGGMKVGGQPGENPPLLIASMFHNKDRIVDGPQRQFRPGKGGGADQNAGSAVGLHGHPVHGGHGGELC